MPKLTKRAAGYLRMDDRTDPCYKKNFAYNKDRNNHSIIVQGEWTVKRDKI